MSNVCENVSFLDFSLEFCTSYLDFTWKKVLPHENPSDKLIVVTHAFNTTTWELGWKGVRYHLLTPQIMQEKHLRILVMHALGPHVKHTNTNIKMAENWKARVGCASSVNELPTFYS